MNKPRCTFEDRGDHYVMHLRLPAVVTTKDSYTKEERSRIKAAYDAAWRKEPVWEQRKLAGRRAADDKRSEIDFDHQMAFARRNA